MITNGGAGQRRDTILGLTGGSMVMPKRFECNKAEWGFIMQLTDPATVIGSWYGDRSDHGPKGITMALRQDRFPNWSIAPISQNVGIRSRMEKYPASTIMTALELPDGRIFVIEGMHRACALALMTKQANRRQKNWFSRLVGRNFPNCAS